MSLSHAFLKNTRLVHLYLGVFISPALIFFAFTGALQTFSLHETTRGSSYRPPAWAVTLGQLHKKQTTVVPVRKLPVPDRSSDKPAAENSQQHRDVPDPTSAIAAKPTDIPAAKPHNTLPLKIFFLLVAVGLFTSTITGLYMSYKFIRNKPLITATLIAGIIVPIVMAMF